MPIRGLARLFALVGRPRKPADEIDAELRTHFELLEAELVKGGHSPSTARAEAIRRFGDLGGARAAMIAIEERRQRRLSWGERLLDLAGDFRLAARQARRQPAFALIAIVTLSVGIGAALTVYSVLRSVLLKPLPYRDPDALVMVWEHNRPRDQREGLVAPANYLRWKERNRSFIGLAIYTWSSMTLLGDGPPEVVAGREIETNLLSVLGARPALGRDFTAGDGPGGVVILSDQLWRRRFGADPGIIGRRIAVAGSTPASGIVPTSSSSVEVVGVMPADFRRLRDEEYWQPFNLTPALREPRGRYTMVLGRLRPGTTVSQAQSEMDRLAADTERELPQFDTGWGARVVGLREQVVGAAKPVLLLIASAVGLVLLIAIANVGNLLLGRAVARLGEVGVRTALGATTRRLARAWTIEGVLLVAVAATIGLGLAQAALSVLATIGPSATGRVPALPRAAEIHLDGTAVAAALGLALLVGVGYGTLPTWALRPVLRGQHLLGSGSRTTSDHRPQRLRDALVVLQVSVSIVLLIGAGLLIRSLARLTGVDPGIRLTNVATFQVMIPGGRYPSAESQLAFFEQLDQRIRQIPGVNAVGSSAFVPLGGFIAGTSYSVPGDPSTAGPSKPAADIQTADSGFFAALGIALTAGRWFGAADRVGSSRVILVNEAFARKYWSGGGAVGQSIQIDWGNADGLRQIVGVVGNVHYGPLDQPVREGIYFPLGQEPGGFRYYYVEGAGSPTALLAGVRAELAAVDREVPLERFEPLAQQWDRALSSRRQPLLLLASLAMIAVGLALVGIYGVLSFVVRQRAREIGIRSALGAGRGAIAWSVVKRGLLLAGLGAIIGTAVASGFSRLLETLLYGTTATDPLSFAAGVVGMVVVAGVASALPALQATRIDPISILKAD